MIEFILVVATILVGIIAMICSDIADSLQDLKKSLGDPCREKVCFWRIIDTGYFVSDCGLRRHKGLGPTPHCSRCGGRVVVDGTGEKVDA